MDFFSLIVIFVLNNPGGFLLNDNPGAWRLDPEALFLFFLKYSSLAKPIPNLQLMPPQKLTDTHPLLTLYLYLSYRDSRRFAPN